MHAARRSPRSGSGTPREDHRRPPLPHWNSGRGRCRWCGGATVKAHVLWHPECVPAYRIATRLADLRRAVFRRDRGQCAYCGARHGLRGPWSPDHIVALALLLRDDPAILDYFGTGNAQTLCRPCHAEKTRADLGQLARLRRA